jgi:hypothetical protein
MIIDMGGSHMKGLLQKYAVDGRVDVVPLTEDSRFWALSRALLKEQNVPLRSTMVKPILALDPGETTGLALFDPSTFHILLCQLDTKDIGEGYDKVWGILNYLSLDAPSLEHLRYEDYRVYGHMTEQHSWAALHTAQFIGAIRVAAYLAQVRVSCALAIHAKSFWDDDKLKMCGLYNPGLKHARDAERHLLRYLVENDRLGAHL